MIKNVRCGKRISKKLSLLLSISILCSCITPVPDAQAGLNVSNLKNIFTKDTLTKLAPIASIIAAIPIVAYFIKKRGGGNGGPKSGPSFFRIFSFKKKPKKNKFSELASKIAKNSVIALKYAAKQTGKAANTVSKWYDKLPAPAKFVTKKVAGGMLGVIGVGILLFSAWKLFIEKAVDKKVNEIKKDFVEAPKKRIVDNAEYVKCEVKKGVKFVKNKLNDMVTQNAAGPQKQDGADEGIVKDIADITNLGLAFAENKIKEREKENKAKIIENKVKVIMERDRVDEERARVCLEVGNLFDNVEKRVFAENNGENKNNKKDKKKKEEEGIINKVGKLFSSAVNVAKTEFEVKKGESKIEMIKEEEQVNDEISNAWGPGAKPKKKNEKKESDIGVIDYYMTHPAKMWVKKNIEVPTAKVCGKTVKVCEYIHDNLGVKKVFDACEYVRGGVENCRNGVWKRNRHERWLENKEKTRLKECREDRKRKNNIRASLIRLQRKQREDEMLQMEKTEQRKRDQIKKEREEARAEILMRRQVETQQRAEEEMLNRQRAARRKKADIRSQMLNIRKKEIAARDSQEYIKRERKSGGGIFGGVNLDFPDEFWDEVKERRDNERSEKVRKNVIKSMEQKIEVNGNKKIKGKEKAGGVLNYLKSWWPGKKNPSSVFAKASSDRSSFARLTTSSGRANKEIKIKVE